MDHKTAHFWSKSEQNPQTDRFVPPPYNAYGKHPKRRLIHCSGGIPTCTCRRTRYCPVCCSRDFFRRSRLFFREAAFFSGGEGCEWRAQRATVGKSGDKAENSFSGFIPLAVPRKGFSPHIPASRLFVLFHPTKPTIPQIHTSLQTLTKSSRHYQK